MYFTIIPFFLVANVAIKDPNEWIYGPEYVFEVEVSHWMTSKQSEPLYNKNSTLSCRPREDLYLLCQIGSTGFDVLNDVSPESAKMEYPFLIEFSERGIENIRLPESIYKHKMNGIRSSVKSLSVGADLSEYVKHSTFVAKENSVLGECRTLFNISAISESEEDVSSSEMEKDRNYNLSIVSLPPLPPDSIAVIEKRSEDTTCGNMFSGGQDFKFKIMSHSNKKYIGKNVFKSYNEIRYKVKDHKENESTMALSRVTVELTEIRPAKVPVPALTFNHIEQITYESYE